MSERPPAVENRRYDETASVRTKKSAQIRRIRQICVQFLLPV